MKRKINLTSSTVLPVISDGNFGVEAGAVAGAVQVAGAALEDKHYLSEISMTNFKGL